MRARRISHLPGKLEHNERIVDFFITVMDVDVSDKHKGESAPVSDVDKGPWC